MFWIALFVLSSIITYKLNRLFRNLHDWLVGWLVVGGVLLNELGQSREHASNLLGNWGRSGQVVTLGLVAVLIGDESQSNLLAFGRDVIVGSLLGVASVVAVILAISVLRVPSQLFLGVGFIAGSVVRLSVARQRIDTIR